MFRRVYLTQNILFHWELARGSIWSRGLISLHWIQNPKWGLYHSVDLPLHRAEKGPSPLSAPARSKVEKTKYKVIVVYYYTRLVFGRWWHAGEEVKKQKKKEKQNKPKDLRDVSFNSCFEKEFYSTCGGHHRGMTTPLEQTVFEQLKSSWKFLPIFQPIEIQISSSVPIFF